MVHTPPQIFDHNVWRQNRNRAAGGYTDAAFLKDLASARLSERLEIVRRDFTDILDLGCHTGQMGAALPARFHTASLAYIQTDTSPGFVARAASVNEFAKASPVMSDELLPVAPASCDAILSSCICTG